MYQWWFYFIKLSVPSGVSQATWATPTVWSAWAPWTRRPVACTSARRGLWHKTRSLWAASVGPWRRYHRPTVGRGWKGWKLSHIFLTFWIQVVYQIESWWEFAICYAQTHPFRTHSLSHFGFGKHPWCFRRWFLLVDVSWCCHMFSWEPPFNLTSNLIPLVLTVAKLSN